MKWLEEMHEDTKYMLAGIIGAMSPIVILLLTGISEIIFCDEMATWIITGTICLFWILGLLVLENDKLHPEKSFIWLTVFVNSAIFGSIVSYILVGVYVECLYEIVCPWGAGFLAGIQWVVYLGTVYFAELLWLLIRIIMGIVRSVKAKKNTVEHVNYV